MMGWGSTRTLVETHIIECREARNRNCRQFDEIKDSLTALDKKRDEMSARLDGKLDKVNRVMLMAIGGAAVIVALLGQLDIGAVLSQWGHR